MGVTSYYSFGGEIIGEETGGVRRDYLTDALGSVTATVTNAGVVENTYRYKPYGEQLAKTGVGSDPRFLWGGVWGYDNKNIYYIRARHYNRVNGIWMSHDPAEIIGCINYYSYVMQSPVTYVDDSGMQIKGKEPQKPPIKQKSGPPKGSEKMRVTCYGDCWRWSDAPEYKLNCQTPPPIGTPPPFGEILPIPAYVPQIIPPYLPFPLQRCPVRSVGAGPVHCKGEKQERNPHDGDCAVLKGNPRFPPGSNLKIYDCQTGKFIRGCKVCDTGPMPQGSKLDVYVSGWDWDCTKSGIVKDDYCVLLEKPVPKPKSNKPVKPQ